MSEKRYKRFYVSESENQLTIYDNEGLDDYYHLGNDERDVKGICDLLNQLHQENEHLIIGNKNLMKKNEQLKKQLELRTESDKYHQRMLMKWLCKDE